ncbi:hypothetical protein [Erythrobacter sp.]|uniref:hypothetical protein n=1 Tax=Erythrobacter sp. TaxID=1042 RepID=UPI0025FAFE81|nr:hypothetical protein [Erythrobacter sp.]
MATSAQDLIPMEDAAWFTASELEDLGLPGLPGDKRSINRRAQAERWASRVGPDIRFCGQVVIACATGSRPPASQVTELASFFVLVPEE